MKGAEWGAATTVTLLIQQTRRVADIVPFILGLVLVGAALLKAHQVATEPLPETGVLTSKVVLAGAVEVEILLGLLLLFGTAPRRVRQLTGLCFLAFLVVNLYLVFSGEASCGCFGRFGKKAAISPWHMVIGDALALTGLWVWRPPPGHRREADCPSPARVAVVVLVLVVGSASVGWVVASSRPKVLTAKTGLDGGGRIVVLDPKEWLGETARC